MSSVSKCLKTFLFIGSFASIGFINSAARGTEPTNTLPYLDPDFSCTTDQKVDQFTNDFNIDVKSFGGNEKCDSKIDTKKLFNDLQLIEEGKFEIGQGENLLIKGFVSADNYYGYVKNETRGIRRGMDIPMATAYNSGGYFTMQDGWSRMSTLGRVGVFIHEARHTEGYIHVPCTQGSYAGNNSPACDENFQEGGSHGVEMEYYARVATMGKNFHPVYKTMARLMAMARGNFVFNEPILTKKESLLVQDLNGQALLLNNQQLYPRETPNLNGRLKRTSFGGVIFTGAEAFAIELYARSGFSPNLTDTYSYFKILKSFDVGTNWSDLEEFDIGVKRYLMRIKDNKEIATYNFKQGRWDSFKTLPVEMSMTSTALENGDTGYFIISKNNEIYQTDPSGRNTAIKKDLLWNPDIKKIVKVNGKVLILKNDGFIYEKTQAGMTPFAEVPGAFKDIISVPVYNAFAVQQ